MATFAVTYTYSDTTSADRDVHRPAHVDFLRSQFETGRLLKSGPFADAGAPGALLIIQGEDVADVEALMNQDPFHVNELLEARTIRTWNIFFGA